MRKAEPSGGARAGGFKQREGMAQGPLEGLGVVQCGWDMVYREGGGSMRLHETEAGEARCEARLRYGFEFTGLREVVFRLHLGCQ